LQALGTFAVPTFLFVSGAFLSYASRELSFTFVRTSLGRILWPYVTWSTLVYGLVLVTSDAEPRVSAYVKNLLVGFPYHFVPLLVFWYVTAPFVVRIGRRHGALLLVAIGVYQVLLLALRRPETFGLSGPLPTWMYHLQPSVLSTAMSEWAVYFPLGLVLSLHTVALKPRLRRVRWLALAAVVGLFVAGILDAFEMLRAPWARFAVAVPLMFLLPVVDRNSIPFVRAFEFVGRRSYGVYLAHFFVINAVTLFASTPASGLDRWPLVVYPTLFVSALGGALLLMGLMVRILPSRRAFRYVFGIAPPVDRTRDHQARGGAVRTAGD
jgi:fucose 4-O-acetylase-like acetyltransferase